MQKDIKKVVKNLDKCVKTIVCDVKQLESELDTLAEETPITIGAATQIPFVNGTADDFSYNNAFTYSSNKLVIGTTGVDGEISMWRTSGSEVFNIKTRADGLTMGTNNSTLFFKTDGNTTLGNGTSSLGARFGVKGSGSTSATKNFLLQNSSGTELFKVTDDGVSTFNGNINANGSIIAGIGATYAEFNSGTFDFTFASGTIISNPASGNTSFKPWGTATVLFLKGDGKRVGVGTTSPTARMHIKSSYSTSATTNLLLQNSSGTELLKVLDNGVVTVLEENVITETNSSPNNVSKMWSGSQAQYDALTPDSSTIYFII